MQYGSAINGIRRFANETERGGSRADKSVRRVDQSTMLLNRSLRSLNTNRFSTLSLSALRAANSVDRLRGILLATTTLVGGLGTAFTVRGLQEYSDTWAKVGNRLRIVKGEAQTLGDLQEKIFDIAQRSRSQFEATGVLFARIAASARRLNIAQTDTLRVTETIQKSFLVGGATPVEAAQSSIQLSQGIASNRLQGDELRSVLENPALGQLLADRITSGDIGKLRTLAAEGELTAGVVVRAFKDASSEIDALFAETTQTVSEAFVRLDNAILKSIGQSGKINAGARASVSAINLLADNIDDVIDSVQLLGVAFASVLGGRAFAGITGMIAQQQALRRETLATARAQSVEARAALAGLATSASSARREYVKLKNSVPGQLQDSRKGMFDENVKAAADAEVKASKAVVDANTARIASTRNAADATAKATVARKQFIAVARAEKEAIYNAVDAAKSQKVLAQSQVFQAKAARDMAASLDIGERAISSYDRKVAVAVKNSEKAANDLITAETRLASFLDGSLAKTKAYTSAKTASAKATAAARDAARKAATARLAETKAIAELTTAQNALTTAQKSGTLTEAQRAAISKQSAALEAQVAAAKNRSAAASGTLAAANKAAAVAQAELNSVLAAQTLRATAARAAMRGLSATVGFLGGPAGVALLALGGIFFTLSKKAQEAEERAALYGEAIKKAGDDSSGAAIGIREAGRAMEEFTNFATEAERVAALAARQRDVAAEFAAIGEQIASAGIILGDTFGVLTADLRAVTEEFKSGNTSAEEYIDKLDEIGTSNPDLQPFIAKIIAMARVVDAARGVVDRLSESMRNLGAIGKSARPGSVEANRVPVPDDIKLRLRDDLRDQKGDLLDDANKAGTLSEFMRRLYGLDPEEFGSKQKKSKASEAEKQLEKFNESITKLRQENASQLFSDLDQKVISTAQSFGVSADEITRFVQSGASLSEMSPQIAMIRAELEAMAENERLKEFADDTAEAFGDFFRSVINGSESFGDALANLGKRIADLALEMLVIQPIVESLKNSFRGGLGGGGGLLSLFGGFGGASQADLALTSVGLFHKGGSAGGKPASSRIVPMPSAMPKKMHSGDGMKHNELMALLEDTENVITAKQTGRIAAALGSVQDAGPVGGVTYAPVYQFTGTSSELEQFRKQVERDRREFDGKVIGVVKEGVRRRVF